MATVMLKPRPAMKHGLHHGFTLIEVLVSLVIFSLAMAVMSQALFQSSKMLDMVDAGNNRVASQWSGLRGLQEAVANMTVEVRVGSLDGSTLGARARTLQGLVGTPDTFRVWTRRFPLQEAGAVRHMAARLVAQDGGAQLMVGEVLPGSLFATAAQAGAGAGNDVGGEQANVASLPRGAAYVYLDADGQEHANWPVPGREKELLPRAILLRQAGPAQPALLAAWPFDGPARSTDYSQGSSFLDLVRESK